MVGSDNHWRCGADLVVKNLHAQGVKQVFGIPGAKIDRVFDALEDEPEIKTVVVRHEANAAFMAAAVGRLTGKAGVALVTSGPGSSNLITGLATATSEGDAVVALGGAVKRADNLKQTHQSMDTVSMFRPVTKYCAEVHTGSAISEVMANAFRSAEFGRPGAAFISLPMDIINEPVTAPVLTGGRSPRLGAASTEDIHEALKLIQQAKCPVLLLGLQASRPENSAAIRHLLQRTHMPVVGTYQAAGVIDANDFSRFAGRVGLFNNQPADQLLQKADLVVSVGYSPIEYDPCMWNSQRRLMLVHIDVQPAEIDTCYRPDVELVGNINATINLLTEGFSNVIGMPAEVELILSDLGLQRAELAERAARRGGMPIHPLRIVKELQDIVSDDVTLCVDMGSFHIWIARYLYSFRARQLLISNGQQTMGVALPWAIGAALVRPGDKVLSISGDGGFMQSSMELETAVRLKANIVHVIWVDNAYNMVEMQEVSKYQRKSGVEFGPIDFKAYAEACGAVGFAVQSVEELRPMLRKAMEIQGPVVVAIPVDYADNYKLMAQMNFSQMI
ncbi:MULTISPECIES: acetolactate synthase AlsS [Serratia]|jgi:acetolactate synthase-1/2/3 large subunit|uniref:acetolactate synthase AlsS n=1 Tax=Serratia TaxID=613 RepID=UPI0018EBABA2|nr:MULTISPECIES: acetolactate synthase AlsS [Serratia]MBE0149452.1 acetolactate synthase AlsS [Serratia fonticola]MDQ7211181.1 acetolactate synthase AlsS [Serratia fonticola]HBE9081295.1 acetolactate synthase AlsS [Serratia fonticola]HBE9091918.1 acetolactate synthase AlsS [Serratia fonticola]HBE9154303.1 acetolactate synthase AlsS [Serratia fonticola]